MSLYTPSGYLDMEWIDKRNYPFNIIIGARGVGKTYSTILYELQNNTNFIYLRRTDRESDISANKNFTPLAPVCDDLEWEYNISKSKPKIITVTKSETEKVKCAVLALVNISGIRGFNGLDYDAIIFDEFIPEKHARPIRSEAEAFWNAYETVNRNRELEGLPPLKVWFLANSNNAYNPILADLGIVNKVLRMQDKHIEIMDFPKRGLQIIYPCNSPISSGKSKTALYTLVNSDYSEMAISNNFRYDSGPIVSRDLREYKPVVQIGEVCVYSHKATGKYYLSFHISGNVPKYGTSEGEMTRLRRRYGTLLEAYSMGRVEAESAQVDTTFHYITGINR